MVPLDFLECQSQMQMCLLRLGSNLPGQTFVGKMGGIRQLFEQRRLRISTSCLLSKGGADGGAEIAALPRRSQVGKMCVTTWESLRVLVFEPGAPVPKLQAAANICLYGPTIQHPEVKTRCVNLHFQPFCISFSQYMRPITMSKGRNLVAGGKPRCPTGGSMVVVCSIRILHLYQTALKLEESYRMSVWGFMISSAGDLQ